MASEKPEARPIVDGASEVVVAATQAATDDSNGKQGIGLRELLLTVLAPTLALIGVAVGVWDNARSEEAARKRDEAIRTAGLVLPYYEEVINSADAVDFALDECDVAWDAWANTPFDSQEAAEAKTVVDEKCGAELRTAFASLDSSLNQALLVSDDDLEPVVADYQLAQSDFAEIVTVVNSDESLDLSQAEYEELLQAYDVAVEELAAIRQDLVEVVRAQVLLQSGS